MSKPAPSRNHDDNYTISRPDSFPTLSQRLKIALARFVSARNPTKFIYALKALGFGDGGCAKVLRAEFDVDMATSKFIMANVVAHPFTNDDVKEAAVEERIDSITMSEPDLAEGVKQ